MHTFRLAYVLLALVALTGCRSAERWRAENSGTYLHTADGTRRVSDVVVDDEGFVEVHEIDGRTVPLSRRGRVESDGATVRVDAGSDRYTFSTRSQPRSRSLREAAARVIRPNDWAGDAGRALADAKASIAAGKPTSALASMYKASASAPDGDLDFARELEATWGDLRAAQGEYAKARAHYDAALGIGTPGSTAKHDIESRRRAATRDAGRSSPTAWRSRVDLPALEPIEPLGPIHSAGVVHHGVSLPPSVAVRPRAAWGARAMRGNATRMTPIQRITVHHSVCCSHAVAASEAIPFLRSIQRDHMDGQGWADIGYHFVIDTGGTVWEGRTLGWQGAHAGNSDLNRGNVGICLLGDFDRNLVDNRQSASLDALVGGLAARYGVRVDDIVTHRELKATGCPGENLQRYVERYRQSRRALARQ